MTMSVGAQSVVVDDHGRGPLRDALLGSVSPAPFRLSPCPGRRRS
ncbi:hypothetical protein ACFPM0_15985 [Pseudonocardia sulfidoxydans]